MTDRLRRLDALFAQRVLGWTECDPTYVSHRWEFTDPPEEPVTVGKGKPPNKDLFRVLPHYTRSLDHAWQAMQEGRTCTIEPDGEEWEVYVWHLYDIHGQGSACEKHPATSLVLACLRAVSTPEEELA